MPILTNDELADEIRALANLMTIAGDDEQRIRRYSRLADTIENLPDPVYNLYVEGKLTSISGVGGSTANLIGQYFLTGTSDARKDMEQRIPASVLDLLAISGIGIKTAQRLYQELGIADLDALEAALDAQKIRALKGMSAKSEDKMREGLALIRRRNVERPLGEVARMTEYIGNALASVPDEVTIAQAGEARRGIELPRSVRVVIGTENIGRVCVALERIHLGDGSPSRHIRGEFGGGFPIHVLPTPRSLLNVTLLRESGDSTHIEALNERARSRNLPPLTDEAAWSELSEEAIYSKLGLAFIPPELRDNPAAVELAETGSLPNLIRREDYRGELHTHTTASDGVHSLDEMAQAAMERGYEYHAVCDHSRACYVANGLTPERLFKQIDEIRDLNKRLDGKITLLAGSEVDILREGILDFPDEILERLDWVVASVHQNFNLPEAEQTRRICRAMENPHVRVIGHPTGRLLGARGGYQVNLPALIEKAAETGVALELNSASKRLDLSAEWCARAREAGVPISMNTDAHHRDDMNSIVFGLATARRAGLEPRNVINTWSLEELRAFRRF